MRQHPTLRSRLLAVPGLGTIRVQRKHLFTFPAGLIGFEHLKQYVVVTSPELDPLRWLLAVEDPTIGLPVLLPWYVVPHYELPPEYTDPQRFVPLVVVATMPDSCSVVVNLKAPILLDLRRRQGQQLILPGDRYSATHPLGSVERAAGRPPC